MLMQIKVFTDNYSDCVEMHETHFLIPVKLQFLNLIVKVS